MFALLALLAVRGDEALAQRLERDLSTLEFLLEKRSRTAKSPSRVARADHDIFARAACAGLSDSGLRGASASGFNSCEEAVVHLGVPYCELKAFVHSAGTIGLHQLRDNPTVAQTSCQKTCCEAGYVPPAVPTGSPVTPSPVATPSPTLSAMDNLLSKQSYVDAYNNDQDLQGAALVLRNVLAPAIARFGIPTAALTADELVSVFDTLTGHGQMAPDPAQDGPPHPPAGPLGPAQGPIGPHPGPLDPPAGPGPLQPAGPGPLQPAGPGPFQPAGPGPLAGSPGPPGRPGPLQRAGPGPLQPAGPNPLQPAGPGPPPGPHGPGPARSARASRIARLLYEYQGLRAVAALSLHIPMARAKMARITPLRTRLDILLDSQKINDYQFDHIIYDLVANDELLNASDITRPSLSEGQVIKFLEWIDREIAEERLTVDTADLIINLFNLYLPASTNKVNTLSIPNGPASASK